MVWFTLRIHGVGMIYAETCSLAQRLLKRESLDKLAKMH